MNLLLTNDDGYGAPGLMILAEKLSKYHNVYIIAPESNRSAVSHHISMFNELQVKQVKENHWTCSGYPADCVGIGLTGDLLNVKFDAVVSGINCGANMGTDIIYSGTCGAARQSILTKVPAVAVSLDPLDWQKAAKEGFKFDALAEFVAKNVEKLASMAELEKPRKFVNVNGASIEKYKGFKFTTDLCKRLYDDKINLIPDKEEGTYISKFKPGYGGTESPENGDFTVVQDGFISISLVYADPVCASSIDCNGLSL